MGSVAYTLLWLVYGLLNPAYLSYKTVKNKNVKDYVRLMMYWVVFALYTFAETFADIFISWLPFYWEMKIVFFIWLILPATKGSTLLYTKLVHPMFLKREKEVDKHIDRMKEHCYNTLVFLGSKGFGLITNLIITATVKGQTTLVSQLKSLSLTDLRMDDDAILFRKQNIGRSSEEYRTTRRRALMKSHSICDPVRHSDVDNDWSDRPIYGNKMYFMSAIPEDEVDAGMFPRSNATQIYKDSDFLPECHTFETSLVNPVTPSNATRQPPPAELSHQSSKVAPSNIDNLISNTEQITLIHPTTSSSPPFIEISTSSDQNAASLSSAPTVGTDQSVKQMTTINNNLRSSKKDLAKMQSAFDPSQNFTDSSSNRVSAKPSPASLSSVETHQSEIQTSPIIGCIQSNHASKVFCKEKSTPDSSSEAIESPLPATNIVEASLLSSHPTGTHQSETPATPTSCTPPRNLSKAKPPTKSSGFTKSHFLMSFSFFDKGSRTPKPTSAKNLTGNKKQKEINNN